MNHPQLSNPVALAPLNSVETTIFDPAHQMATNEEMNAFIMDIHDYRETVWQDFTEEYFVFCKTFIPFQHPPNRKVTFKEARSQLKQFVKIFPVFKARRIEKIMSKLLYFHCPPEKRDFVTQMCCVLFQDQSNDMLPMTDDESQPRRSSRTRAPHALPHENVKALTYPSSDDEY